MKGFEFNKLRMLQYVGLLDRQLDPDTGKLRKSRALYLYCQLVLFLNLVHCSRLFVSIFWEREHPIQLLIGNYFNYLQDECRFIFGLLSFVYASWVASTHLAFRYYNAQDDYRLFNRWIELTHEIPAKSDRDYRVVGLPWKENKRFWLKEKQANWLFFLIVTSSLAGSCFIFNVQLFLVPFDAPIYYTLIQTINLLNGSLYVLTFFNSIYSMNFYFITCVTFLSTKFRYLADQVQRLNASEGKRNNRRLTKLITDYNLVQLETIEMNAFFKNYTGYNILHYSLLAIFMLFMGIFTDLRLKLAVNFLFLFYYLAIIYLPCRFASSLTLEIERAKRKFETTAFARSSSLRNRLKIETISNLSERSFTCFDWFSLSSYWSLKASLEICIYILLLIQTYWYYSTGFYKNN